MWDKDRPIYNKLPLISENWQGNDLVDILTGFWDELLVQHKNNLTNPIDWLGTPDQINVVYLDWVAIGLCGLQSIWKNDYPESVKREIIKYHKKILQYRGSLDSCNQLVRCFDSEIQVSSYADQPRAGISLAGATVCGSDNPTLYHILVPTKTLRNGKLWQWLESIRLSFFPVGDELSRVQYQSLAGYSVAGDGVTGQISLNYSELP